MEMRVIRMTCNHFVTSAVLVACLLLGWVSCESYRYEDDVVLPCSVPGGAATWDDDENTLFTLVNEGVIKSDYATAKNKYDNFGTRTNGDNTQFNLTIGRIHPTDGGLYQCNELGSRRTLAQFNISVEALPDPPVSMDCSPVTAGECPASATGTSSSEFMCTCTATGVYPATLNFEWEHVDSESAPTKTSRGELFDITANATVRPSESANNVRCFLSGYVNEDAQQSEAKESSTQFSSPTCSLEVVPDITPDTDCGNVSLRCNCDVSDVGLRYSFYKGDTHLTGSPSSTNTLTVNTTLYQDSPTYSCRVCNGIYYGKGSVGSKEIFCPPITSPATTPDPDGGGNSGSSIGLIIGVIVGVLVVIIVVVIIVYFLKCREGGDITATNGTVAGVTNGGGPNANVDPDNVPPVYAEVNKEKNSKNKTAPPAEKDPEIPAYGVVNKPNKVPPQPAPRGNSMELQYADLDHSKTPETNQIRIPQDEPTEYATVQSVVV